MKENNICNATKTCLQEGISIENYVCQIFFEKIYLERCKNLANNESRGIPQSRGILLDNPAIPRD